MYMRGSAILQKKQNEEGREEWVGRVGGNSRERGEVGRWHEESERLKERNNASVEHGSGNNEPAFTRNPARSGI